MAIPNFENKHLEKSLINPDHYGKGKEKYKGKIPERCIILYQDIPFNHLKRKFKGQYEELDMNHTVRFKSEGVYYTKDFLFSQVGLRAPSATIVLEEMMALGVNEFISMGRAGGLRDYGVFLCEKAIRDEGTSYHYVPPSKYSYPDEELTKRLEGFLKENNIKFERTINWTTDALFMETEAEIRYYRNEGVVTVDMEASALFAVAGLREAKIAAAFVVSDVFLKEKWERGRDNPLVEEDLIKLTDAVVDCFSYTGSGGKE